MVLAAIITIITILSPGTLRTVHEASLTASSFFTGQR
ncbi:hypothetical protein OsccyDRAFT_4539 [Leptolyngbyaceae cyanobacterium JSC-12]|nr:hypothetical protein OsccyDRAFT_4539 [Leptolyngbyaceae cyanobacterium JSC-12]